ncbi:MAG: hypothetical protein ABEK01_04415 [Candidatus Nanohaloarchaea archaeon]
MNLGLDRFRRMLGGGDDLEDDADELEDDEQQEPDPELKQELYSAMERAEDVSGLENRIELEEYEPEADLKLRAGFNGFTLKEGGKIGPDLYTKVIYGDELMEDDEDVNTAKALRVVLSDLDYKDRLVDDLLEEYRFSEQMVQKFLPYQERRTVIGNGVNYQPVMFDDALKHFLVEGIMNRKFEYDEQLRDRVEKVREEFRTDDSIELGREFSRTRQSRIEEYAEEK